MTRLVHVMFAAVIAVGCGGGKDCEELCTEAQAGDCTAITGSCATFCAALDDVQEPAGCTDERDAYEACLDDGDAVCSNTCNGTENALETCVGAYCAASSSNASCQALIASF